MRPLAFLLVGALLSASATLRAVPNETAADRAPVTEADLPAPANDGDGSEIDDFSRHRGFRYGRDTRRAARGDFQALKKFFQIANDADGAARESIEGVPTVVCHVLGDEKLAKFLAGQPIAYRMMVRNLVGDEGFIRDFPQSSRLLFQREMVGWPSPNDLYAIRKVLSDEFKLSDSKVTRAELIEKKSGRLLCDLTPDDIGTGAEREGDALWSSDSMRVACLSSDLPDQPGNLFSDPRPPLQRKQTTVYQRQGDSFARVDLSLGKSPGEEIKGAVAGHIFTEPVKWRKPNVLVLQRHEYYGVRKPMTIGDHTFETIADLGRLYKITATIAPDGKGTAVWKLRPDH